jgi:DNA mismatch repair protein MSH5
VLGQLLPTTVLTSSNADSNFVSFLESTLSTLPSATSSASNSSFSISALSGPPTRLEIRPAREFYAGQGRHVLSQLEIREGAWYSSIKEEQDEEEPMGYSDRQGGMEGDAMRRNRELRLESFMNGLEKSPLTVREGLLILCHSSNPTHRLSSIAWSSGCLAHLSHQDQSKRRRSRSESNYRRRSRIDEAVCIIRSLLSLNRDSHALVSTARSLCKLTRKLSRQYSLLKPRAVHELTELNDGFRSSLQFFEQEAHASMHATRGKEGLSIFSE